MAHQSFLVSSEQIDYISYREAEARLPDSRLLDRLNKVSDTIEEAPHMSFPALFSKDSELDAFYRLIHNPRIEAKSLLHEKNQFLVAQLKNQEEIFAIHDTTGFDFTDQENVTGLGRMSTGRKGFFGHFSLAVKPSHEILELLGIKTWIREKKFKGKRTANKRRNDPTNEQLRWLEMMEEIQKNLPNPKSVIHVADRESDDYVLFSGLQSIGARFVIRIRHSRKITGDSYPYLFDSVREAEVICEREVPISARKASHLKKSKKIHPDRSKRKATLTVSAKRIEICRSAETTKNFPKTLVLNFVRVFEINPPEGEKPIEWILGTTEPIEAPEDLLKIVDTYCTRWVIEEYFKALKTGCSFEKRGLRSLDALLRCLALMAPIAIKLYNLKILGREHPEQSVQHVLTQTQIQVLSQVIKSEAEIQTTGEAMWAVAQLGGHIRRNGSPGWQVLARGYEKLLQLVEGWLIAVRKQQKWDAAICGVL